MDRINLSRFRKNYCEVCDTPDDVVYPDETNYNKTYYGLVVHHVIPLCFGGENTRNNLITLCHNCHNNVHSKNGRKKNWSNIDIPISKRFLDTRLFKRIFLNLK